jgi:fructokinase
MKQKQPDSKKHKILCIGEILWDMLPDGAKAGGAPMNVALHLKKFGLDVKFAGRIGFDNLGHELKDFLTRQGLDTSLLQVDPDLPTSTVQVHLQTDHQVNFEIVDNVAWDRIELTDNLVEASKEATVIIFGTLASRHQFTRNNIIKLLDNNCLKLIDVNLRTPFISQNVVEKLLQKANIAKLNDDELKVIAGWHAIKDHEQNLTRWFAEKYECEIVCVTRGANGALIYNKGRIHEHPGYKVRVNDTVGSGDAFLAGFLATYLNGEQLNKSLGFACATGALVATKAGGTPDYHLDEIDEIIRHI